MLSHNTAQNHSDIFMLKPTQLIVPVIIPITKTSAVRKTVIENRIW